MDHVKLGVIVKPAVAGLAFGICWAARSAFPPSAAAISLDHVKLGVIVKSAAAGLTFGNCWAARSAFPPSAAAISLGFRGAHRTVY
ncbi:MAG: hypothetical protein E7518_03655 [Ruminococcaceae bacterium]|nr:hypothetical protein [Oscillospiraceae bacterium]HHV30914.1 hypothetical protein [Clostridiales bacterium]